MYPTLPCAMSINWNELLVEGVYCVHRIITTTLQKGDHVLSKI